MDRKVEVSFDEFGWQALTDEAGRQGVSLEELVAHAAMYYLAEPDRGLAHRVLRGGKRPGSSASPGQDRRPD